MKTEVELAREHASKLTEKLNRYIGETRSEYREDFDKRRTTQRCHHMLTGCTTQHCLLSGPGYTWQHRLYLRTNLAMIRYWDYTLGKYANSSPHPSEKVVELIKELDAYEKVTTDLNKIASNSQIKASIELATRLNDFIKADNPLYYETVGLSVDRIAVNLITGHTRALHQFEGYCKEILTRKKRPSTAEQIEQAKIMLKKLEDFKL